jgi:hypothetical protein
LYQGYTFLAADRRITQVVVIAGCLRCELPRTTRVSHPRADVGTPDGRIAGDSAHALRMTFASGLLVLRKHAPA